MAWKLKVKKWLETLQEDDPLRKELLGLQDDEKELEDCFYKDLEFGTGGMRGIIGPGPNRMNIYTVRKAAMGLAKFIKEKGEEAMNRGVVIAYDSRHHSFDFALEAAKTIGHFGIKTYIFKSLRATPVLSFAVRHLHAYAGIVITASHNPPEYNGFKVYGPDGAQLLEGDANQVIAYTKSIHSELEIEVGNEKNLLDQGLLTYIGEKVDQAYVTNLQARQLNKKETNANLKIVFSPLHGTAGPLTRRTLKKYGFEQVHVVEEQEIPDANFSTVEQPNPEEHDAFELAIRDGEKTNADILLATDPDADRLGVAVKNNAGEYEVLTGNQTGALMLYYLLNTRYEQETLARNGLMLKTIVTSELGKDIAQSFGVGTKDTLTGFKYIAENIRTYSDTGKYTFLFGYEESYGYLIHDFVRDKDAIQSLLLVAEMAATYKEKDMTLYDALDELFEKYGYYKEDLHSITLPGKDGVAQIKDILERFRSNPIEQINNVKVIQMEDYQEQSYTNMITGNFGTINLPKSNVIKYKLVDGSWFCIRPSGTEPKCKFYFGVKGNSQADSEQKLTSLKEEVLRLIETEANV